jgi:hypothetical protein
MIPAGSELLKNTPMHSKLRLVNLDEVKEQFALMAGN